VERRVERPAEANGGGEGKRDGVCGDGGGRSPESGGDNAPKAKKVRGREMEKRKGRKEGPPLPPISFSRRLGRISVQNW